MSSQYERERRARVAARRRAAVAPVRVYPRDVPVGVQVWVRLAEVGRVQGELVELSRSGRSDYLVVVEVPGHGRVKWTQAAAAKIDVVKGQGVQ